MMTQDTDPEWREAYSAIITALAAIVNVRTPDKLFDLNALPRDPVMTEVMNIRRVVGAYGDCRRASTNREPRESLDQTFAGLRVVIDPNMPPDTIKFVQPEKAGAPVAAALREALESLYSAVIEQNRRGAEWDPEVFDRLMPALAASKRALAGETP